jgi:hypothetical protein
MVSRMEGWEERESKEGKEKGKKTKQKKNRAKEINRERYSTNQQWAKHTLERQREDKNNNNK